MEELKNKRSQYEEPKFEVIHMTDTDTILTSDWDGKDYEGEFIQIISADYSV